MNAPLNPDRLAARLNPADLPWETSADVPPAEHFSPPQPRALAALNLALHVNGSEHNIYLAGSESLGRTYFLRHFLTPAAAAAKTPDDILYVFNFDDEDRPRWIALPAGQGRQFKADLAKAFASLREDIPAHLEQDAFMDRRGALLAEYKASKDALLCQMDAAAEEMGFALTPEDDGQLSLAPRVNGRAISQEEFEELALEEQKRLRAKRDEVMTLLGGHMRKLREAERGFTGQERALERELAQGLLDQRLESLQTTYAAYPRVTSYLKEMASDVLENLEKFLRTEPAPGQQPPPGHDPAAAEDFFTRYEAHLLVDNSHASGAPVVVEDHPTPANLLGVIERESEMGALYTDFTLIKAGALHKANGGFLILKAEELLQHPAAWEGLLRALRNRLARLEDASEQPEPVRTRTIEPEPLPLSLKVCLVGTDETYEQLLYADPRFRKLFKIKAHLQDHMDRNPATVLRLVQDMAAIIAASQLKPFDRSALAGMVDYASRLSEDQQELSLRYPLLRELMVEASATAAMHGRDMVDAEVLTMARQERDFRANLYEEEFLADYDREIIKVSTSGMSVGRVNGLSVAFYGDYEFGLPHHIACTVGVGREGIIDLEREAELGGPIHTKAMMILKSYLLGLFAYDKPIILSGSLYFEQSYAEVEGDSASGAELAALLSALADAPINLAYAFTGAVSQSGAIMAVGGVTRKIEGFFEVCRRRGLTGSQGVIIPADNVRNLMLKPEVVEAVEKGLFAIYPVTSIEQALEILTGRPAGARLADGTFPDGTLYHRVDARLAALAQAAERYGRGWRT